MQVLSFFRLFDESAYRLSYRNISLSQCSFLNHAD